MIVVFLWVLKLDLELTQLPFRPSSRQAVFTLTWNELGRCVST